MTCLDESHIAHFLEGLLAEGETESVEAHLDACADCRALIVALVEPLSATQPHETPPAREPSALKPGTSLGRYVVKGHLGIGGMGVVYSAWDPELDRGVALKVLRPSAFSDESSAEGRRRLVLEAKALASLSHPNVVPVYDVGTEGERVFIAMELIEGANLAHWLREEHRAWREVLEIFTEAGRGLAAAHAAGIVHRDFKPENVLVGRDGRVLVTDFGLARSMKTGMEPARVREPETHPPRGPRPTDLTRSGVVLGTPAYMAPEQHRGEIADARTDQFAFCVALYEGLYGARPFEGDSVEALALTTEAGGVRAPPKDARVPAWLHRAVVRGLRPDPDERFEDMDGLLTCLLSGAARRRRFWQAAGTLVVLGGLGAAITGWALSATSGDSCRGFEERLAEGWSPKRRQALQAAFLRTRTAYARKTWRVVAQVVSDYADRWLAARRRACRRVKAQGPAAARRVERCLSWRLVELGAVVDTLVTADKRTVERSLPMAHGLGSLERCFDTRRPGLPRPDSPAVRQRVQGVRRQLAHVRALRGAGRNPEARTAAVRALEDARKTTFKPLIAEAHFERGRIEQRIGARKVAEAEFREAVLAAQESRYVLLAAHAWTHLVYAVGWSPVRLKETVRLSRHAKAALGAIGGDAEIEASLAAALGNAYSRAFRIAKALPMMHRVVELRRRLRGRNHPEVAVAYEALGITLARQGSYTAAEKALQRALDIRRRLLGAGHPIVAVTLNNLGILARRTGKIEQALELLERSLAIRRSYHGPGTRSVGKVLTNLASALSRAGRHQDAERALREALAISLKKDGEEHRGTVAAMDNLGAVLRRLGRLDEARRMHERAIAISLRVNGPDHPRLATAFALLSEVLADQGKLEPARRAVERALAIKRKRYSENHPRLANTFLILGRLLFRQGHHDRAARMLQRCLRLWTKKLGGRHWRVATALTSLANVRLATGKPHEAVALARRSVAILAESRTDPRIAASARFTLARALWKTREDRHRAMRLAGLARAYYARKPTRHRRRLQAIDRWLRRHRGNRKQ